MWPAPLSRRLPNRGRRGRRRNRCGLAPDGGGNLGGLPFQDRPRSVTDPAFGVGVALVVEAPGRLPQVLDNLPTGASLLQLHLAGNTADAGSRPEQPNPSRRHVPSTEPHPIQIAVRDFGFGLPVVLIHGPGRSLADLSALLRCSLVKRGVDKLRLRGIDVGGGSTALRWENTLEIRVSGRGAFTRQSPIRRSAGPSPLKARVDTDGGGCQRGPDCGRHLHRPIAVGIELRGHSGQAFDSCVGGRNTTASCTGDAQRGTGGIPIRVLSPIPADSQGNRTGQRCSRRRQRLLAHMDARGHRAYRERRGGPRPLRDL